ncbi:hypothetical protein COO59_19545 [Mixta theicola]|uniref:Uncharacterized protein n=1 Tax=Mixta theicola TaxID=1458355 RepID=A0A2K1Q4V4_9GAMM|nr:hypothetical protein [Mixta theicola]PNS10053.1 hypothetical protein COO59_19545 [Mixta theicola]GLR09023.1 hypothetical protein GCM10007905_17430 [Mixta theicola]
MLKELHRIATIIAGLLVLQVLIAGYFIVPIWWTTEAQYTEQDWLQYHLLTQDEIKCAPRITKDYIIEYHLRDGPSPYVGAIKFKGATETTRLEHYLLALGYRPAINPIHGKMWASPDRSTTAYIYKRNNEVELAFLDEPAFESYLIK